MKELAVFDWENYPDYALVNFLTESGKRRSWNSDDGFEGLEKFVEDRILVGFNSKDYDVPVLNMAIAYWKAGHRGEDLAIRLKQVGNELIQFNNWRLKKDNRRELHIDVLEVLRQGFNTKPLKLMGVSIRFHNIEDLPYKHDEKLVTAEKKAKVSSYCWNDVEMTAEILKFIRPRIEMRQDFGHELGLGLSLISEADSGLSNIVFDKFYSEESGIPVEQLRKMRTYRRHDLQMSDVLKRDYKFQTPEMKAFYEHFISRPLRHYTGEGKTGEQDLYALGFVSHDPETLELIDEPYVRMATSEGKAKTYDTKTGKITGYVIDALGVSIAFGLGGIHTEDEAGIIEPQKGQRMIDIDVEAYYPFGIIIYDICPAHLDKTTFKKVYKTKTVDARIEAKGKKSIKKFAVKDKGLKILINNVFGKYNFPGYWLYDPLCAYQVTVNNQLGILELAEMLYLIGAKIISINTDGVTVMIDEDKYEEFKATYNEWEKRTGFKLEEAEYTMLARLNINNYFAKKPKGAPKAKGAYLNPFVNDMSNDDFDIMKGFDAPIVSIALYNWLKDGTPYDKTVTEWLSNGGSIHDFCIANRVGDDFENVLQKVKQTIVTHSPKTGKPYKKPKVEIEVVGEKPLQKTVRYFVAHTDVMLMKRRKSDGSYQATQKGWCIMPFNKVVDKDWSKTVNYDYYIKECEKIVKKLTGEDLTPIE